LKKFESEKEFGHSTGLSQPLITPWVRVSNCYAPSCIYIAEMIKGTIPSFRNKGKIFESLLDSTLFERN